MLAEHDDRRGLEPVLQLDTVRPDHFRMPRFAPNIRGGLFGGQLLTNALTAAMQTTGHVEPHMMQATFLRAGDLQSPMEIHVERVRDGRRFMHRRVSLTQLKRELLTAEISFHSSGGRLMHQAIVDRSVPRPDALIDLIDLAEVHRVGISIEARRRMCTHSEIQIRPTDPERGLVRRGTEPRLSMWIKPTSALPADPLLQYAATAYMSDLWLPAAAIVSHVDSIFDGPLQLVSLNHCIWFHARPSTNDWILYSSESPAALSDRGLARGLMHDPLGRLVATTTQEALIEPNS